MKTAAVRTALLEPVHDPRWARLVAAAPEACIFHHPAWLALVGGHYRYALAAAVVLGGDGEAVAGLPLALVPSRLTGRRLVALPASDACPPLVLPAAPPDTLAVLARTIEHERLRRQLPIEVRAAFPCLGAPSVRFLCHAVVLHDGVESAEGRFTPQVRRNVRKARREGVTVDRATDIRALETFYELFVQTRRRLGVPTQPKAFVRGLAGLFAQDLGFVAIARLAGHPVAAAVFLRTGGVLTYKYGASDRSFQHVRPNNLLFAQVIRWACEEGALTLDLGRTDLEQDGLAAFKRSWGAIEAPLAYTYHGGTSRARGNSRAEQVTADLIRRSPAVVGRAIGEVAYRHMA